MHASKRESVFVIDAHGNSEETNASRHFFFMFALTAPCWYSRVTAYRTGEPRSRLLSLSDTQRSVFSDVHWYEQSDKLPATGIALPAATARHRWRLRRPARCGYNNQRRASPHCEEQKHDKAISFIALDVCIIDELWSRAIEAANQFSQTQRIPYFVPGASSLDCFSHSGHWKSERKK